jgi:glutamate-1-semialdehyde 2,1-aminomutase
MPTSTKLFNTAAKLMPGGVNSPVRAFNYVGSSPKFIARGEGAYIYDEDNKEYIDYVGAYGPMIAGHSNPNVIKATTAAIASGLHFGAPHRYEVDLAQKIISCMPQIEKIRLVSSGTEACMSAIRLARAYTKRAKIIKFNGCYHGHSDSLLVNAGSGALSLGEPSSPGVLKEQAEHTLVASYNDIASVEKLFTQHHDSVAAIIVEPIAGNMGMVLPQPDFLQKLQQLCHDFGALLIFDEVMTGFRVALGGASAVYNITADITVLGKIIGGGLPIGAFGGRADIMNYLAPIGPVYQAGTLSGSPIACAAGLATLEIVTENNFYAKLHDMSSKLTHELCKVMHAADIDFQVSNLAGMFGFFFTKEQVVNFPNITTASSELFKKFFLHMLEQGINVAPSPYEAAFISAEHGSDEIDKTVAAASSFIAANSWN